jgi:hypothetical protein
MCFHHEKYNTIFLKMPVNIYFSMVKKSVNCYFSSTIQ